MLFGIPFSLAGAVTAGALVISALPTVGGGKEQESLAPDCQVAVLDTGKVTFTVTNDGQIGRWGFLPKDPLSCEYPKGSRIEHLFGGGVWIGGIVDGDTLVSVGSDGWLNTMEMYPDRDLRSCILHRSPGVPGAISDQDFGAVYADTLVDGFVVPDPFDGPHRPLNIRIVQAAYAWADPAREDFVLLDLAVKNIGPNTITDAWVGMYVDADVYHRSRFQNGFADDLAGYLAGRQIAYILDNDGDPAGSQWNDSASARSVFGMKVVFSDPPVSRVNFNWWDAQANVLYDWGPRRAGTPDDPFRDFGTGGKGTPTGDRNKFYMLSHDEQDYDALWAAVDMTAQGWMLPGRDPVNLANGWDARFLYSFGPYTIPPDSSIRMIIAVSMGEFVHAEPADFATYFNAADPQAFYDRLNFSDLMMNMAVAESVAAGLREVNTACFDFDTDGLCYDVDNCPVTVNPDGLDSDGDGLGDGCDNCPQAFNPYQEDLEGDGIGDSCEVRRTWLVKPDGTGDAPTIKAALDSSFYGDTILLADGVFSGDGNRDLVLKRKEVVLRSAHGPNHTIIYCGGKPTEFHRAFFLPDDPDGTITIEGITIRRGYATGGGGMELGASSPRIVNCVFRENRAVFGGGLFAGCGSSPTVTDCKFIDNTVDFTGGGVFLACGSRPTLLECTFSGNRSGNTGGGLSCWDASPHVSGSEFLGNTAQTGAAIYAFESSAPTLTNCPFARNDAAADGGAIYLSSTNRDSTIRLSHCTFSHNSAPGGSGAGISIAGTADVQLERSIIAFSQTGAAVSCVPPDAPLAVSCCDIFGNAGGDWTGCLSLWLGANGNFSLDPLFHDPAANDFSVKQESPCAPSQNSCGAFVGIAGFCECPHVGDIDGDDALGPADVVRLVGYVFLRGPAPPADPLCPAPNRGDVNCDGLVNLVDVVRIVNFVYRGPGLGLCDPCAR